MSRPTTGEALVQLTTRISQELVRMLTEYTNQYGLTKREVIEAALEEYLNGREEE